MTVSCLGEMGVYHDFQFSAKGSFRIQHSGTPHPWFIFRRPFMTKELSGQTDTADEDKATENTKELTGEPSSESTPQQKENILS